MSDLLWADPLDEWKAATTDFTENEDRGRAVKFGSEPLARFLTETCGGMKALVRAHEVKPEGHQFHMLNDDLEPQCITVFSAPNYCGFYENKGAVFCSLPNGVSEVLTYMEARNQPPVLQLPYTNELGHGQVLTRADAINYHWGDLIRLMGEAL